MDIKFANQVKANPNIPMISPGDTVKVSFRVKEANRERLQTLPGLVVKVRKGAGGGNFTIRRVASAIGVEHTFPFASPLLEKVEVVRHGKVRRAKLYYIRRLSAREARLKERREKMAEELVLKETADVEGTVAGVAAEDAMAEEAATAYAGPDKVDSEETKESE
jgi:large subunit ribosomal protein L19